MLQLLKKLKLYTKLGPVKLGHFKIYIRSFVDYQHLQKYFYNWNITWNYSGTSNGTTALSVKSMSGLHLSGNTSDSTKWWYFGTIVLPFLKKYKIFKSQKIDPPFLEILIHTTVGLIEKGLFFPEKTLVFGLSLPYWEVHRI